MTPEPAPPTPDALPQVLLNAGAAAILMLLAAWMTVADFLHAGDPIFQSSASFSLAFLAVGGLSMLAVVLAIFPKRLILAINLLFLSRMAIGFPFSIWMESAAACRLASTLMLVLAIIYLVMALRNSMRIGARPWLRLKHSAAMVGLLVFLGVLSIPVTLLGFERGSRSLVGHYVKFSFQGVTLTERVFRKDGQDVHLVGMMHIGDGRYYRDLNARMSEPPGAGKKRLVLTEGVSDSEGILPEDFASGKSYGRIATALGIESQPAMGPDAGPAMDGYGDPHDESGIEWENADIDISELNEPHRKLLVAMLDVFAKGPLAVMSSPELARAEGSHLEDLFKNSLILARNDVLMSKFDQLGPGFTQIYIPWGAAHMPDIEARLLQRGYVMTHETVRPVLAFRK